MDILSYTYADAAHIRIDELELSVTSAGTQIELLGSVLGLTNVNPDGSITLSTVVEDDSHNHTPATLIGLDTAIDDRIQLRSITENGNQGWRLTGKDPTNYGNIGDLAIDLSHSTDYFEENGAIGTMSFATGEGTVAKNSHSFVTGRYNRGLTDTVVEVGIGTNKSNRQNALEVYNDGRVLAPSLTPDKITEPHSFVTKKYIDDLIIDCGIY